VQAAWDERQKLSDLRDSVYMQWKFFHGFGLMAYHLSGSATQDFPDVMTESDRVLLAESDELALEGRTDEIYRAVYPLCDPKGAHATQANSHACREFTKSYRRIKTELSHLTSADASFLRRVGEMNDATARLSQSFIVLETEDLLKEVDIISDIAQQARPIFILFIGAVAIMITVLILGFVALVKPLHRVTRAIQDFRGTNRTPERNIRSSLREINEVVQWVWMLFEKLTDEEARSRELFANYRELLTTSNQDALTGIANRRALNDFISRTTDVPPGLGILMIDIDLFKSLNDTRGHILGDRVLRTLASVLDRSISTKDEVFRYGGEEFCVICTGTDDEMLARTSERLLRAVRTISRESGLAESEKEAAVPLTVSIGVAPVTQAGDGRTIVQMIHEADEALYRAKRNGRNRIETGPDDETEPADEERA
ncbi:GGDEF domain-containing protein, partial [Sutterella sp.]|uniref:GGDEF domain-containing protein n=1 Tax=Sutterella sp. TaxID=1981025 RepID=UPI0026DEEDB7